MFSGDDVLKMNLNGNQLMRRKSSSSTFCTINEELSIRQRIFEKRIFVNIPPAYR